MGKIQITDILSLYLLLKLLKLTLPVHSSFDFSARITNELKMSLIKTF